MEPMTSTEISQPVAGNPNRLTSLDVIRGITLAFMVLVNHSPDATHTFRQLDHVEWNGWTFTDMVFPTFLFLMGTSIVFSTEARLRRGATKGAIFLHTLQRFVILCLLGLVVNGFPYFHLATLRFVGVLQRTAICFLIVSALYLWDKGVKSKVILVVLFLFGYWALLRWVPVPGYGMPGRDVPFMDEHGNLTAYIDRLVFPGRLYVGYRDPEGILSTIPSLATALLGMLTGLWLRSMRSAQEKARGLLVAGIAGLVLGEIWNIWFPINKNMWTSSFVLFTAGFALVLFAFCYYAIEIKAWKRGWAYFFLVFGTNAITAYVLSQILGSTLNSIHVGSQTLEFYIYTHFFSQLYSPYVGSLIYALLLAGLCWLAVSVLYRKKIFIKV